MMPRLRHVAPAGVPLTAGDLARWAGLAAGRGDVAASLTREVCRRADLPHAFLTATGRAGVTVLLRALATMAPSTRDEVVLPSYTCYSVAAAIVKAGLRPRVVDVHPGTLDFSPDALAQTDFRRVLAIVATNPYGLPNDLPAIVAIAREHGVFVIDDAAQSMGARVGGRASGSWGDAGVFSFDKGKGVPAVQGGVVVTGSDEVAAAMQRQLAGMEGPPHSASAVHVIKAIAGAVLLRPSLYWIPNGIPQLGLGQTVYSTAFPLERPGRLLTALARVMIERLDELTAVRRENATALMTGLAQVPGIRALTPVAGAEPAYLRLPLLAADATARDRALLALRDAGIGASASYPQSIADVPELASLMADPRPRADGGRYVARHILTLPTHPYVTRADISLMVSVLAGVADDHPAVVALPT